MLIKASKNPYDDRVKLHAVVTGKNAAPYTFLFSVVSPASIHDLRILEENISETEAPVIIGDKAYTSKKFQSKEMIIPKKKPSGGKLSHTEQAENKRISKTRQVIESSFAWLHSRTGTRKAHLVLYLVCLYLES